MRADAQTRQQRAIANRRTQRLSCGYQRAAGTGSLDGSQLSGRSRCRMLYAVRESALLIVHRAHATKSSIVRTRRRIDSGCTGRRVVVRPLMR